MITQGPSVPPPTSVPARGAPSAKKRARKAMASQPSEAMVSDREDSPVLLSDEDDDERTDTNGTEKLRLNTLSEISNVNTTGKCEDTVRYGILNI